MLLRVAEMQAAAEIGSRKFRTANLSIDPDEEDVDKMQNVSS